MPWKGTIPPRVRIPPGKLSLQPVAIGADDRGNDIVRSTSMKRVTLGVELTRFRGYRTLLGGGIHDATNTPAVSA